jgi:hypothetical protein
LDFHALSREELAVVGPDHGKLTSQLITMKLAERELHDLARPVDIKRVQIEEIQRIVARHYNVSRVTCCRRGARPMWCGRVRSR